MGDRRVSRPPSSGRSTCGVAIASVAIFGQDAGMLDLMPSFMAIGIGGDLTIPLTATVLGVILTSRPPTRISSPWPDPRAGAVSRA
ncbi:hypothetical protein [Aeromicrobium sp.]|uniref:hypothetical protein n=1 Tax=Aeromicrobium sp. TaxID=1871063 RepID=UPI00260CABD1|nr:hypothetical protein [Aeromicrobium sp.]